MSIGSKLSRRRFVGALSYLAAGSSILTSRASAPAPIAPKKIISLFNGKNLDGWYPWLATTKYDDPKHVFSVVDGMLRITGEVPGYLGTRAEYREYHLIAEYKWGELTYGAKTARNSGILLHATGPDGNHSPWTASIECQIAQGCVGDFIVIRGQDSSGKTIPVTITSDTIIASDGKTRWKRGGKPTVYFGSQFWWSEHEPGFEEIIDTRGKNDPDSPLGQWTRLECICRGDRITVLVNGKEVNECYAIYPNAGKILLESEGFEILFRKIELHPL